MLGFLFPYCCLGPFCLFNGLFCPLSFACSCCFPPLLAPKVASYDPLVEFLEPEEISPFGRRFPVPLPSLPGSPNPFQVSPGGSKASSNPLKEQVQEPPLHNDKGLGEAEQLLQAEVRDLTSQNVFLAMEVDKLKEQLESTVCVPKHLCRGSF